MPRQIKAAILLTEQAVHQLTNLKAFITENRMIHCKSLENGDRYLDIWAYGQPIDPEYVEHMLIPHHHVEMIMLDDPKKSIGFAD